MDQVHLENDRGEFPKNIVIYIATTFVFSWLVWLPLVMNHLWNTTIPLWKMQFYVASFGPFIGAFVATGFTQGLAGIGKWIRRAFSFHFSKKWILIAFAMPVIYGVVAIPVHVLVTGDSLDWSQFGLTEKLPGFNLWQTAIVWILTFGLGEEAGWRGYLLPELFKRYSIIKSSLLVAVVWILWHLPAFAFNPNYIDMGWGVIGWVIGLLYGSLLLSWLCKGSNWSIIPVIIWHAGFDLITASDDAGEVIAAVCSMLVIVHGIIVAKTMRD